VHEGIRKTEPNIDVAKINAPNCWIFQKQKQQNTLLVAGLWRRHDLRITCYIAASTIGLQRIKDTCQRIPRPQGFNQGFKKRVVYYVARETRRESLGQFLFVHGISSSKLFTP
jgi:hypothetical protein